MRKALALFAIVLTLGMTTMAFDAEARRLGGGRSTGMQRQAVTQPHQASPAQPGSPAQVAPAGAAAAAAAPAAAAAKRSWMGPLAGLAAGIGIAALASHFGFGEGLANMLTMALIAMAVLFAVRFFLRKKAMGQDSAMAGAGGVGSFGSRGAQDVAYRQAATPSPTQGGSVIGSRIGGGLQASSATAVPTIPADFDVAAFQRTAKEQFMALQAANDARDLDRLRDYLSPEMFEIARAETAERGAAPQDTQVFGLDAQVLEVVEEPTQYVVSVRFTGSIREQKDATPEDLNEVWHLVKPTRGFGGWVIAGIQQA